MLQKFCWILPNILPSCERVAAICMLMLSTVLSAVQIFSIDPLPCFQLNLPPPAEQWTPFCGWEESCCQQNLPSCEECNYSSSSQIWSVVPFAKTSNCSTVKNACWWDSSSSVELDFAILPFRFNLLPFFHKHFAELGQMLIADGILLYCLDTHSCRFPPSSPASHLNSEAGQFLLR